jgi:hypothetical protein
MNKPIEETETNNDYKGMSLDEVVNIFNMQDKYIDLADRYIEIANRLIRNLEEQKEMLLNTIHYEKERKKQDMERKKK